MRAGINVGLPTSALHVVQPDSSVSVCCIKSKKCSLCSQISELSADGVGTVDVPAVVTDCTPLSVVEDLYSSLMLGDTISQANLEVIRTCFGVHRWRKFTGEHKKTTHIQKQQQKNSSNKQKCTETLFNSKNQKL